MKTKMFFLIALLLGICNSHAQAGSLAQEYDARNTQYEQVEKTRENFNRRLQEKGHTIYCPDLYSGIIYTFVNDYVLQATPGKQRPSTDELIKHSLDFDGKFIKDGTQRNGSKISWRFNWDIRYEYYLDTNLLFLKHGDQVSKHQCEVVRNNISNLENDF